MMFASIGDERILTTKGYFFEPKLDGYRALCIRKGKRITLISRNNLDITADYPELQFAGQLTADCVLDGEIVIYDEKGNPSFPLMQERRSKRAGSSPPAHFVAFDILMRNGIDLTHLPLHERKKILQKTVRERGHLQLMAYTENGPVLWKHIVARNTEGIVAKRMESKYLEGRSRHWIKVKREQTADCVIVGYASYKRAVSSLALGLYNKKKLVFSGKVGTGFDEAILQHLAKKMRKTADNGVELPADITPVAPTLVCEIKYLTFTSDHKFRAPVFLRIRSDKRPADCVVEQVHIHGKAR